MEKKVEKAAEKTVKKAVERTTEKLDTKHHPRESPFGRFIYPVLSRRSGGLSLGVNLNPDKKCNFDCVYCQVTGREEPTAEIQPDLAEILTDLEAFLSSSNPLSHREIKDFAIAGDGEPTQSKILTEVILGLVELKQRPQYAEKLQHTKIILFTNGAGLRLPKLEQAMEALTQSGGEVWFKLDFWDEASYQRINRSPIQYQTILTNLRQVGLQYPLVLQSCFFADKTQPTPEGALADYLQLVQGMLAQGVKIQKIQAYTLAREAAEDWAVPHTKEKMDQIAEKLKAELPKEIAIELYYDK